MMKFFPLKLIPDSPSIDFMKIRKMSFTLSLVFVFLSFISIGLYKFNFGIDFAGGIKMEVKVSEKPDIAKMRKILADLNIGEISLMNFGDEKNISIKASVSSEEKLMQNIELIKQALHQNFEYEFEYQKVDFVGPQIGGEMIKSGSFAMCLAFIAIMLYVWVRFEWQFGLGVLLALVHDVIVGLGFMSFFALDFNISTIAAILTIIGYSVNDSVVIYDRIRENLRKYSNKSTQDIINMSINETLSRTTITALTTLLANLALIIWGGEAIFSFSILVFFGVAVGTYSSIFISAPILSTFNFNKLSMD